ncbi:MAG: type II toxin-antitoxin system RelE/ParE family toxin [Clostridia bacterium]|nr:type II toxin-antitoxin system RelE/ParE family toxin [Clostridia bacterium]
MKYEILYKKKALKFIQKQPPEQQKRIILAISRLPFEGDIKPLAGMEGEFRLRVGDYRIRYTVDHGRLIVTVIDAGNRGDVYKS